MILCSGEALIDMLPRETVGGENAFAPFPGGAVFNTAIALGRLGAPAGYFGGLSSDMFGRQLVESLSAANVSHDFCPRSSRPTTLAFVTLSDGQAQYAFYDENTAGRMLGEADIPKTIDGIEALFFGGISLVSEPSANTLAAFCAQHAGQVPIMIDPNVRPGFITDTAAYRARLATMLGHADIIKVSDEDMEWIGTTPEDLLDAGAALVLITKGAEGVTCHRAAGVFDVPAKKVEVVDTVGAGDTFNAGLLTGLWQGKLLNKKRLASSADTAIAAAVTLGAKAAAVTVSRAGANPPWAHEI